MFKPSRSVGRSVIRSALSAAFFRIPTVREAVVAEFRAAGGTTEEGGRRGGRVLGGKARKMMLSLTHKSLPPPSSYPFWIA